MTTLKPCPDCNNKDTLHTHYHCGKFFAKCHFCGRQTSMHAEQEGAIMIWNGELDDGVLPQNDDEQAQLDAAVHYVREYKGTIYMDSPKFYDALDLILKTFPTK
jgi:hypothetical protein